MKKRTVAVSVSASVLAVAGMLPQVTASASPQHHPSRVALPATAHRVGKAGFFDARQGVTRRARTAVHDAPD